MGESAFVTIYRYWTWIGIPVMLMALAALVFLIWSVVATVKKAHLFKVSLSERQEVQFAAAEPVVLSIEGPRFTTRMAHVNFQLTGVNGDSIEGRRTWFRARTSGISTARMELLEYHIPRPGRYVLRMTGLGAAQEGDARHAVVFMRPHLMQTAVYVVGIVLTSMVFIVSLVFFALRLGETGPVG
jgi:hypothetical protein